MLLDQLKDTSNLTLVELSIAKYASENALTIISLSANDLAKLTHTSRASVFRLCKKLGYSSFDLFKTQILQEQLSLNQSELLVIQDPFYEDMPLEEIQNILPSFYQKVILKTNKFNSRQTLQRVINYLHTSEVIDIYGSGITLVCANGALFKFQTLGKECHIYSTINEHYLFEMKKKTTAILLSFTGRNEGILSIGKYLKNLNIRLIGIGGKGAQELREICDEYLEIDDDEGILAFEVAAPYLSMNYLFDILFLALVTKNYELHKQKALQVKNQKKTF